MAQSTPAMTPAEALQTIADVRRYREGMTARAAGLVWMVWGIVITLVFYAGLFVDLDGEVERTVREREALHFMGMVGSALALAAGAVVTNAIWQAHALESGRRHPRWVAFAVGFGLLALFAVLAGFIIPEAAQMLGHPLESYAPMHLFTAMGALALTLLQRNRVRPATGYAAAALLLLVFVATFIPFTMDEVGMRVEALALALVPLVAYIAVGLVYFRQG